MYVFLFEILVVVFAILMAKKDYIDDNPGVYKNTWWSRKNTQGFSPLMRWFPFRDGSHALRWVNNVIVLLGFPYLAYHFLHDTNFIPLTILTVIFYTVFFYTFYHHIFNRGK